MRFVHIPLVLIFAIICGVSCRKDFEYAANDGKLEFSQDTVFLDTIFSNIGSSTYVLKVYNRSKEDIAIPTIGLAKGEESGYRLNVDGVAGKVFSDVPLMARDSLFIFIEMTFDITETTTNEFLYTDELQFGEGDLLQEIPLVTLVRDAIFLYPSETLEGKEETILLGRSTDGDEIFVDGFELGADQLNFNSEKPYVIYGYAVVPEKKILNISAGARVHFHKDSGILVKPEARLQIKGEISSDPAALEKEVIFEGDRLEPDFENVPGQWNGIWIASGSTGNTIDYLTIKNATVGLRIEGDGTLQSPTLTIKNTQIYDSAIYNLWGISAYITGENLVLGSAGSSSLYCNLGGNYSFIHTTIANYWTNSFRTGAALSIDASKNIPASTIEKADLTRADFINCIIDGNGEIELSITENSSELFNYLFRNCLIRFQTNDMNSSYDFEDSDRYQNILPSQMAAFINANSNNFRLAQK